MLRKIIDLLQRGKKRFLLKPIKRVSLVDVWYDASSQRKLPEVKLEDRKDLRPPFVIDIDGAWAVQHKCPCCNSIAFLGRDELVYEVHQPHFIRFPDLSLKYFELDALKAIKKCFVNLKLVDNGRNLCLISKVSEDNILIANYNCSDCDADFLATYKVGYGTMGLDDREGRTVNTLYLEEVVMVHIADKQALFKYLAVPIPPSW